MVKVSKKTASKPKIAKKTANKIGKLPVNYEDIVAAAKRIKGIANKTPVMTSRTLNQKLGAKVFLKCENF